MITKREPQPKVDLVTHTNLLQFIKHNEFRKLNRIGEKVHFEAKKNLFRA